MNYSLKLRGGIKFSLHGKIEKQKIEPNCDSKRTDPEYNIYESLINETRQGINPIYNYPDI